MVWLTVNPNLRAASCWRVEVVNGGAGLFFTGFLSISVIVNSLSLQDAKKASASSSVLKPCANDALMGWSSTMKTALTLYTDSLLKFSISFSRSTISRTATLCTRPAERLGFSFFHNTGEILKPTILSNTRRACCAFTKPISMVRGVSIAFKMALFVISWKTILFAALGSNPNTWLKCQEMASPSRSSSEASQTVSAFFASFFNSFTTASLSEGISYSGEKSSRLTLISFFFKSRMCPYEDITL